MIVYLTSRFEEKKNERKIKTTLKEYLLIHAKIKVQKMRLISAELRTLKI